MTRAELWAKIAQAIEQRFDGRTRIGTATFRPDLSMQDAEEIANIVFSTIGHSDLEVYQKGLEEKAFIAWLAKGIGQ